VQKKKKQAITAEKVEIQSIPLRLCSLLFSALLCAKSALLCKGARGGLELVGNAKRQRESKEQQPLYKQADGGGKPR